MTMDLFDGATTLESQEQLAPGAMLLRGFAVAHERELLSALAEVIAQAPFRNMITPGGFRMSVGMSNCGALGWISDTAGYRYGPIDPLSGQPWPPLPEAFLQLATSAAERAGFSRFVPDACLINCYEPGSRLSLHQDRNERDFREPIVSVSLGLPVVFLFGGSSRSVPARRIGLMHGDVVVWGGPARLSYHGVLPLKEGFHSLVGAQRLNLTLRKAG
ncbi:DNA oxidative demethylase AlkB [Pseudomonas sp. 2FG]|uniref:DNA oxidative demethylase AlkB n=1 Tax=Pseudomonas sp. 2FG TaxID=2502191 RepID=UPI0010F6606D|nr:DNA oxidative demethylase AlkB [Pseudomonas sp. 2FG]